jgi:hypothetical protein
VTCRVPTPRRTRAIVGAILAVLDPPADELQAVRATVVRDIADLRKYQQDKALGRFATARERRDNLDDHLKALCAAADTHSTASPPRWHNEYSEHVAFGAHLDAQIERIKSYRDAMKVKGHRPVDLVAAEAVQCALFYLCPHWHCRPLEDWPVTTAGKPWHLLSTLLYEAGTGHPDDDNDKVLNYMAKLHRARKKNQGFLRMQQLLPWRPEEH